MYFVISGLQGDVHGSGWRGTVTAVQGLLRSQHQWTTGRLFNSDLIIWFHLHLRYGEIFSRFDRDLRVHIEFFK
jgi:hypothetical protein